MHGGFRLRDRADLIGVELLPPVQRGRDVERGNDHAQELVVPVAEAREFQGAFLEAGIVADVPQGGGAGGLPVAEAHTEQGFMEAVFTEDCCFHHSFPFAVATAAA